MSDDEVEEGNFPRYTLELAKPKPFLMPSFDNQIVSILPSEKSNRKIRFDEDVLVQEIENRFAYMYPDEDDDDDSYEIEIVEDDGDADFYLEIVDGEVFYVFETEDDISDDEEMEYEDSAVVSDSEEGDDDQPQQPLQLDIAKMSAPDLDSDTDQQPYTLPKSISSAPVVSKEKKEPSVKPAPAPASQSDQEPMSPPTSTGTIGSSSADDEVLSTPVSPEKPKIGRGPAAEIIPEPASPIATNIAPASPVKGIKNPGRSILKACPESPKVAAPVKKKKPNKTGGKKEKTFTKTYVRAEQYDGEHRVYTWEKPSWTEKRLRSTGKGDDIRQGANLANPITFPKKKPANAHLEEEGDDEKAASPYQGLDKDEIVRRIMGGDSSALPLIGYRGKQRKLKFSIHGSSIRSGGDIVKPITQATQLRKKDDVNKLADPKKLKATSVGSEVRQGKDLQAPVTMATVTKKYEWEKPAWAKGGVSLRKTGKGDVARKGDNLARPITQLPHMGKEEDKQQDR